MKSLLKFLVIFTGILLLSAALAPWLFTFLPFKFERIFNRLVMIFSIAAIVFFVRIRRETIERFGIFWDSRSLRFWTVSFVSGLVVLGGLLVVKMGVGDAEWSLADMGLPDWGFVIAKALVSALVIGFIEEIFFRGFIFNTLRERFSQGLVMSLVSTNVFYALLHFVSGKKPFVGPEPTFWDSLRLMQAPFMTLGDWQAVWPGAIGLFIFGLVLNMLFLQTRSLYPSIGFHAGCVFFIKMDGNFFFYKNQSPLLYGSSDMYDGLAGWILLALSGWILYLIMKRLNVKSVIACALTLVLCLPVPGARGEEEESLPMEFSLAEALNEASPEPTEVLAVVAEAVATLPPTPEPTPIPTPTPVPTPAPTPMPTPTPGIEVAQLEGLRPEGRMKEKLAEGAPVDEGEELLDANVWNEEGVYQFAKHLHQAETVVMYDFESTRTGQWAENRFFFPGLGAQADIRQRSDTFAGEEHEAIYVHPVPKAIRRLRFHDVPTGSKLVVYHGISDEGVAANEHANVYLKIWIGKHPLARIRVPNEAGWNQDVLDLGVLSFLKEPVVVTFDIEADSVKERHFHFLPEIHR
ncbi:MAG: CPBP family intramembrane metalloprotease [Candidatus Omnitrophota bacterium]|nr:CPBP family intramembrane metalloprotease [Candidatus Omnitrophota bacterium]